MYEQDYHYLIQDAPKMNKYINLGYDDEKAITFHVQKCKWRVFVTIYLYKE